MAATARPAELFKSIPITAGPDAAPKTVMSLRDSGLFRDPTTGELRASAEVQVSVCLKSAPRPSGKRRRECLGRTYGYDPKVTAGLVVAAGQDGAGREVAISKLKSLRCRQAQPARNHHCVITIPWSALPLDGIGGLPCGTSFFDPEQCRVNLVLGASHPRAHSKDRLVVGAFDQDTGRVERGKGAINAARFFAEPEEAKPLVTRNARTKRLPIGRKGTGKRRVIHSLRIPNPRGGTQLLVTGGFRSRISSVPYTVFTRTELIVAHNPKATRYAPMGNKLSTSAQLSPPNGFNCTHAPSAFRDPCPITKTGVVGLTGAKGRPVYINLVAAQSAQFGHQRWRQNDAARIPRHGGYIKVRRYAAIGD